VDRKAVSAFSLSLIGTMATVMRTRSFGPQCSIEFESEETPIRRTGCASMLEAAKTYTRLMCKLSVLFGNPADATFFNPLFAGAGNRAYQQKRPPIASLGVDNRDVNREIFTTQHADLPDIERKRTGVLFG